jgi:hypothetical protein
MQKHLVAGNTGIDFAGPGFDAPGNRLRCIESLLAEPVGHAEGTRSVVAEDEQAVVRIEFLMGPRGYVAHRHEQAGVDFGSCIFPTLADINELGLTALQQEGCVLDLDFVVVHGYQDTR